VRRAALLTAPLFLAVSREVRLTQKRGTDQRCKQLMVSQLKDASCISRISHCILAEFSSGFRPLHFNAAFDKKQVTFGERMCAPPCIQDSVSPHLERIVRIRRPCQHGGCSQRLSMAAKAKRNSWGTRLSVNSFHVHWPCNLEAESCSHITSISPSFLVHPK